MPRRRPRKGVKRKGKYHVKRNPFITNIFQRILELWGRIKGTIKRAWPTIRITPKIIWSFIGVLAILLGIFFNLTVDLPQLITNWLVTPTPLPFPRANLTEEEVLVIVTEFTGSDGQAATTRIFRALSERVKENELYGIRIEWLPGISPKISEDAKKIGEQFDATLVIWGTADGFGVEPRYEVISFQDKIKNQPDLGVIIATDLPTFSAYVVNGLPNEFEYLVLFGLGQMAYFSKNYEKAVDLFTEALNIDLGERSIELNLDTVYSYRGNSYYDLEDYQSSVSDFSHAIELNPLNASYYQNRAYSYEMTGDWQKALSDYNQAIEIDPKNEGAYLNRGVAYDVLDDNEAAIADYEYAINLNPNYPPAYENLFNIYVRLGDNEMAEKNITSAIEIISEGRFYYNYLGESYLYTRRGRFFINQGRYGEAIRDLSKAIELNPNDLTNFNDRAVAYSSSGQLDNALSDYNHVIELAPEIPAYVYNNRGNIYYKQKKYELAIADLRRALEIAPDDPKIYLGLCFTYFDAGLNREALLTCKRYMELAGVLADQEASKIVKQLESTFNDNP